MQLRSSLLLTAVALLPCQAWAQAPARASLLVELRQDALVAHQRITLADVAVVHTSGTQASELGAIALGRAPRIGHMERMSRVQIEQAIRRHATQPLALTWEGAAAVIVRTKAQMVPSVEIRDAAMAALNSQFGSAGAKLAMNLSTPLSDVEVPVGAVAVRARAVPPIGHAGRASVWVDLFVDGEMYRSVVVQMYVSVRRQAYVALRALTPGALAAPQDFVLREVEVGTGSSVGVDSPMHPFRVARAIGAGQPLTAAAMVASGSIMRGDAVRVQVRAGQIGIDTAGVAMADARPGEALSVRTAGGRDLVTGRVSQSGTVIVE